MKLKFQGSQKKPIRVTISQKGLGKKFQKIHLFDNQYPKVNGIVTLFTVTNFRPVSTSSTYVGRHRRPPPHVRTRPPKREWPFSIPQPPRPSGSGADNARKSTGWPICFGKELC